MTSGARTHYRWELTTEALMGELAGSVPPWALPMSSYLTELERLPDGSLRISLYRDGRAVHREWVGSERRGRRRAFNLICTAVDVDLDGR